MQFMKSSFWPQWLAGAAAAAALAGPGVSAFAQGVESSNKALATSIADESAGGERIRVAVPYVEMHLGPHRYFPVTFVAKQDEPLVVLYSQQEWFKVRTLNGQEGWVLRDELKSSLAAAGIARTWHEVLLDDYLIKRLTLGVGYGRRSSESRGQFWADYRLGQSLSVEGSVNQVAGRFDGSSMLQLDVVTTLWPDETFSPYSSLGFTQIRNYADHQYSFIRPKTSGYFMNVRGGVGYRIGQHYGVRLDGTYYQRIRINHSAPSFDSNLTGNSSTASPYNNRLGNFVSIMLSLSYSF